MAWGYWSASSVLPDRGRSPRRGAAPPPPPPPANPEPREELNPLPACSSSSSNSNGISLAQSMFPPEVFSSGGTLSRSGSSAEYVPPIVCPHHRPVYVEHHQRDMVPLEPPVPRDEDLEPTYATGMCRK